jgi:hypothetical protein
MRIAGTGRTEADMEQNLLSHLEEKGEGNMKTNLFLIIIATGIGVYTLNLRQSSFSFEKTSEVRTASAINFEKIRSVPVIGTLFSRKNILRAEVTFKDLSNRLEQSAWAKWCKEDPVTSGLLIMVGGIGICLFAFIIHLIRSDARFS